MPNDKPKAKQDKTLKEVIEILTDKSPAELAEHHFTKPEPIKCKWCGSTDIMKYGIRDGVQEYICLKCRRKFNAKGAPYKMRSTVEQIGASLNMFYDGLSFSDIARHLDETYKNPVNRSTVWRWVVKYTLRAFDLLEPLKPDVGKVWVVDETVINIRGHNWWLWDIIDDKTRFLLASHFSESRARFDAVAIMRKAWERAGTAPELIISDGLGVYPDGVERVFGALAKNIQSKGFTEDINTNLIERFHSTVKERTKVLRSFKTLDTAELIIDGFFLHYNFFRPHMTLANKTPAEVAGIKAPVKNWTEMVRYAGEIA